MKLGKVIRELRKKKGLNQKEFATLCGITAAYLSQIETGGKSGTKQVGHLTMLQTIATKLEVPLPILMWFTIEDTDIAEHKRAAWKAIHPAVDGMLAGFFEV